MSDRPLSTTDEHAQMVPMYFPPARTDSPPAARTVRGLLALPGMVLLWVSPKRVGPRLAAAGWRAAIAAHLLGIGYGLGLILWAELSGNLNPLGKPSSVWGTLPAVRMTGAECLRAPLATLVAAAHEGTAGRISLVIPLLVIVAIEAAFVVVALLMMPFAAAGEPSRTLFSRCLRLSWWSTTMLLLAGFDWIIGPQIRHLIGLPDTFHPLDLVGLALFALWWLFVLLRSGYRYAGPAAGPAWSPHQPRCEACGYSIAQLSHSTNCPECGRAVVESLPESRCPTAFAAADYRRQQIWAFGSTLRGLVFEKTFFDRLAVHQGHPRARTFFTCVCLINAILVFLAYPAVDVTFVDPATMGHHWYHAVVAGTVAFIGQLVLTGAAGGCLAALQRRPLQPSALVTFYAMSSLLPLTIGVALLAVACSVTILLADNIGTSALIIILVSVLDAVALVACAWGVFTFARILARASTLTHFANA